MAIDIELRKSAEWLALINSAIGNVQTTATPRRRVVLGFFHLGLEHFGAIHTLIATNHPGSSLALIRPQFEAFIRGTWYQHCATDVQVERFTAGRSPPSIDNLLDEIDRFQGTEVGKLKEVKREVWKVMNDYTHGGALQISGRNSANTIGSNYPEDQIVGALESSARVSLLIALQFAQMIDDKNMASYFVDQHKAVYRR